MVKSYDLITPVVGLCSYGLVVAAVAVLQGNPFGKGLVVKKSGNVGALKVPNSERPKPAEWLFSAAPWRKVSWWRYTISRDLRQCC